MKKLISLVLVLILACSFTALASGKTRSISIGCFVMEADPSWVVQTVNSTHLNIFNNSGDIACNMQFFDYPSNFSMTYDQLLASEGDDYAIAQIILDSLYADTTYSMFGTMDSDTLQVGAVCGLYYYGDLNPDQYKGRYSGTLLVRPEGVLSMMSITTDKKIGITELFDFDEEIINNLYLDGVNIFDTTAAGSSASTGGSTTSDALAAIGNALGGVSTPAQPAGEVTQLSAMSFVTPAGWTYVQSNEYQVIYSYGNAAICLNAYPREMLLSGIENYTADQLTDILITVAEDSLSQTGADPDDFTFTTASLENNDLAVYFEGDGGSAMGGSYMTSAMFVNSDYTIGLITILTPTNDTAANSELLAQCINMYYDRQVITASAIPHGGAAPSISLPDISIPSINAGTGSNTTATTPASSAATHFTIPNAAVLSVGGPSLTGDEMNALGAAITYVAGGSWTYDSLVNQLVSDGYSYDAAVFAADNCGQW